MDRDIFRLIILIIGLLVMAGIYYFDSSRRLKTERQKPWYAESEDSSEYPDSEEYVRVVSNDSDGSDDQQLSENLENDQEQEKSFRKKIGQYSSISELVQQSQTNQKTDPESFVTNPIDVSEDKAVSALNDTNEIGGEGIRFSDRHSDDDLFSPLSMEWDESIDSELEINAALLKPLGDPDYNLEITKDTDGPARPSILMLYLVNTGEVPYQGKDIGQAFEKAGLKYGSMDLYHYTDYKLNQELFSVSNMREPGTFPEQMDYLEVEGIILFMQPMTLSNPAEVYEKMIVCADTLYTELGGEILDDKGQQINQAYLDEQRRWLAS
ncbi:MAG: cell division protein ZipA C-terminal FtsZ-binding domain-containing protein [Methylococcales bacterium]